MLTALDCPAARPVIVHVTVWLATAQVPEAATAESIVRPAGTPSVNVIGSELGPAFVTVADSVARLATAGAAGAELAVTPTSIVVTSVAETFSSNEAPLAPDELSAWPAVGVDAEGSPSSLSAAGVEPPWK